MKITSFAIGISLMSTLHAQTDLLDESLEDIMNIESELTADVGSRSGAKGFLNSNTPVDVITFSQIEKSGLTSLTDVLRYFVAGFNAPETSVADGSDHVRAFTLRGMSSDQVLVLVNGKRLHTSSLLHVNGTIGRGSSNVDLDTVAVTSIEKIEILRDGAAAQYGSDAISGVINIILKGIGHSNSVSVQAGQRKEGDGLQLNADTFISIPLKYDGFVNLTMQAKKQEQTNRVGPDTRDNAPSVQTHVGIPDSKNFLTVLNAEIPQENNMNIYINGILNYRDSEASAFSRVSDPTRPIFPNGFLPLINADILDYSLTMGVKGGFENGVTWDLSNVYGYNNIEYNLNDTINFSLGAQSPTSFNAGSLTFIQNTTNLDFKKNIDTLSLAAGVEYRYESYQIKSGDFASYIDTGSQGFSGYRPENKVDDSRTNYALYIEGAYEVSENFSSQVAVRYENYSDFGPTTNAKLAFKYDVNEKLFLRTSGSTGFRAPSLAQSHYSHTSTFGGLVEGTIDPSDPAAIALGAKDLEAETSKHFTIGSVYKFSEKTYFMIDYFYTEVDDRIMLSNEFASTTPGIDKVRFFTNAVNTETQGIDIKFNHTHTFDNKSILNLGVWYNYNDNKVTGFNEQSTTRENSFEQIDRVENGQPKESLKILTTYSINQFDTTLNLNRYGSYSQVRDNVSYDFNPEWTLDVDLSYKITDTFNLAIGAHNIFDTVPNKWDGLSGEFYGHDGIKQYSRYSPFGYSGAYYYVRTSFKF